MSAHIEGLLKVENAVMLLHDYYLRIPDDQPARPLKKTNKCKHVCNM